MQSYVGKDVREVVLDYGPPANAIDMGEGKRAFQWVKGRSYSTPVVATTNASVNKTKSFDWYTSNTIVSGGETVYSNCIYTIMGEWDGGKKGWIVTGFRKPSFICE
jgi:hypothetical protein